MPSEESTRSPRRYLAVAQQLLTSITQGTYAPGDRLPAHTEVAASMGVARATAREAFLALELIGAIDVRHGDGTFVRRSTAITGGRQSALDAPPQELIECRLTIEPVIAQLAAERIAPERLERLVDIVGQQERLVERADEIPAFVSLGLQFHAELAGGCGNSLLGDISSQLVNVEQHPLWALVNQRGMSAVDSRRQQVEEHEAVLAALRDSAPEAAAGAMRSHLQDLGRSMFTP